MVHFFYNKKIYLMGVFFFIVITLTACSKNKKQTIISKSTTVAYNKQIEIARHVDTPAPIGFILKNIIKDGNVHVLYYVGKLSIKKTIQFYHQEMERLGWSLVDLSTSSESMIFCDKTSKKCAIRITQVENKTDSTTITLYIKEHESSSQNKKLYKI